MVFVRAHLAALDENLLGQRDADGLAGAGGFSAIARPAFDGLDVADFVARREQNLVADFNRPGLDAARKGPSGVEPVNVLDRKPHWQVLLRQRHLESIERLENSRAVVPRHVLGFARDVVAVIGGNRNKQLRFHAELREERPVLLFDGLEHFVTVALEIHLVDDHSDLLDA